MLSIKNLHATVAGKPILKGINLDVRAGEVHAIMGPNGSGKSTLANVLAGRDNYIVTQGEVLYQGENLLELSTEERACKGIFLAFQYPVEIPGVSNIYLLKAGVNAKRKYQGLPEMAAAEFLKMVREKIKLVDMKEEFLHRSVNEGFSGGEKKRNEIFQMAVIEPTLAVLDETDSGLDIDASSWSRITKGCLITLFPILCTYWRTVRSLNRATRIWPWNWKRKATNGLKKNRLHRRLGFDRRGGSLSIYTKRTRPPWKGDSMGR